MASVTFFSTGWAAAVGFALVVTFLAVVLAGAFFAGAFLAAVLAGAFFAGAFLAVVVLAVVVLAVVAIYLSFRRFAERRVSTLESVPACPSKAGPESSPRWLAFSDWNAA